MVKLIPNIRKFYTVTKLFERAFICDQSHISSSFSLAAMLKNVRVGQAQDESNEPLLLHFRKWYMISKRMSFLNALSYNNEIALK